MQFSIRGRAPAIDTGATIHYALRIGPVPITWRSRIVSWVPPVRFIDVQEAGPYRASWHEHTFRVAGSTTVMEDRVCEPPLLGVLGPDLSRHEAAQLARRSACRIARATPWAARSFTHDDEIAVVAAAAGW